MILARNNKFQRLVQLKLMLPDSNQQKLSWRSKNFRYDFSCLPNCGKLWNFICDIRRGQWMATRFNICKSPIPCYLPNKFDILFIVLSSKNGFEWTFEIAQPFTSLKTEIRLDFEGPQCSRNVPIGGHDFANQAYTANTCWWLLTVSVTHPSVIIGCC